LSERRRHRFVEDSSFVLVDAKSVDLLADQAVEKPGAGLLHQETKEGCADTFEHAPALRCPSAESSRGTCRFALIVRGRL
jgi:hypothetical protein